MKAKVAIDYCRSYDLGEIREVLERLISNTDFPDVKGKSVLLKPNVLSDAPAERNITTNPVVVKAAMEILKARGAGRIICGDSPGLPGPGFRADVCGIGKVCEEEGVEWVDFSSNPVVRKLAVTGFRVMQTHYIDDVDLVFSICKMKTHQLMGATGAVKNMFGTVPGLNKSPLHLRARSPLSFAQVILDIYSVHVPEYSIMDGIISMEGAGPANGTPRQTNLLLASSSALSLDRAEAVIMGYNPKDIPILFVAERNAKGSTEGEYPLLNPEDIIISDYRRVPVKKRGLISALLLPYITRHSDRNSTHSRPAPSFDKKKCRRCRKCIDICPAKALTMKTEGIEIDTDRCIRCYCCHEMCPFDAINVKKDD